MTTHALPIVLVVVSTMIMTVVSLAIGILREEETPELDSLLDEHRKPWPPRWPLRL
jgi:hypothetical protein